MIDPINKIKRFVAVWHVISGAPRRWRASIKRLYALYGKLDQRMEKFRRKAAVGCVAGCGKCCENPQVEATVLEMFPAAVMIHRENASKVWLDKIKNDGGGICLFYERSPLGMGKGRCSQYLLRPSVCRLHGFSARRNKENRLDYVTCPVIKNEFSTKIAPIERSINQGLDIPVNSEVAMQIYALDPVLGQERLPINLALAEAIIRLNHMNYDKGAA